MEAIRIGYVNDGTESVIGDIRIRVPTVRVIGERSAEDTRDYSGCVLIGKNYKKLSIINSSVNVLDMSRGS